MYVCLVVVKKFGMIFHLHCLSYIRFKSVHFLRSSLATVSNKNASYGYFVALFSSNNSLTIIFVCVH